jgi:hypothetical protein
LLVCFFISEFLTCLCEASNFFRFRIELEGIIHSPFSESDSLVELQEDLDAMFSRGGFNKHIVGNVEAAYCGKGGDSNASAVSCASGHHANWALVADNGFLEE